MPLEEFEKDAYQGLKAEWDRSPWTVTSIMSLWAVAWALVGVCYFFVYPRLAWASDMNSMRGDLRSIKLQTLDRDIVDTVRLKCAATSKTYFSNRLGELTDRFQAVAGYIYTVPSCEEVK